MDKIKIIKNMEELAYYIDVLYIGASYIREDFKMQPIVIMGCEGALYLSIRRVVSTGRLIANQEGISYEDIVDKLFSGRVIPKWLGENLKSYGELISFEDGELKEMNSDIFYNRIGDFIRDLLHFKKYILEYVI